VAAAQLLAARRRAAGCGVACDRPAGAGMPATPTLVVVVIVKQPFLFFLFVLLLARAKLRGLVLPGLPPGHGHIGDPERRTDRRRCAWRVWRDRRLALRVELRPCGAFAARSGRTGAPRPRPRVSISTPSTASVTGTNAPITPSRSRRSSAPSMRRPPNWMPCAASLSDAPWRTSA